MPGMNVKVETVVTGSLNKKDALEDVPVGWARSSHRAKRYASNQTAA